MVLAWFPRGMLNQFLKKYLWIFTLVLIAGLAALLSKGVGNLIVAGIRSGDLAIEKDMPTVDDRRAVIARKVENEAREVERTRDGMAIMTRNIFDSVTGSVVPKEETDGGLGDNAADQGPPDLLPCQNFNGQVLATVVSDDPGWSFATIKSADETMLYRPGMLVDGNELTFISWRYVFFKQGGGECYYDIWAAPKEKEAGRRRPLRPWMGAGAENRPKPNMPGIEILSDTKRRIDRSVVENALADQDALLKSARVLPYEKDGKVQGFKVYGIRQTGLLGQLGLSNGDIIQKINGVAITSADQALAAYAKFKTDQKIKVDLTRRGQPVSLEVDVK